VAERRSGTDEDRATAGHIERGSLRMYGGAAPCVGRFRGFQPPRQRQIGKNQEFLLSQYAALAHHISMAAQTLKMSVSGMTCGNCSRSVERKLSATPGVTKATVDLVNGSAIVDYDADVVKPEALANAVRQLGYEVPA
jgi:copper chaperone CopZ